MSSKIRNNLERADWRFIREACCATGNGGAPIDRARWPFFAEQWIGPYERLRPEWAYVAEEASPTRERGPNSRAGYLTGCPDSARFRAERRWLFDIPLFVQARLGLFPMNGDVAQFLTRIRAEFTGKIPGRGPEESFPADTTREVLTEYPAHLHMNLTGEARGNGIGRALVERYREDLTHAGVHGIHLFCGEGPRLFYQRVGFRIIDQIEFRPGIVVYRLGSRF